MTCWGTYSRDDDVIGEWTERLDVAAWSDGHERAYVEFLQRVDRRVERARGCVEHSAERDVHDRAVIGSHEPIAEFAVVRLGDRFRSRQVLRRDLVGVSGIEARRIDVEIEMVVHAAEGPWLEAGRVPVRRQLLVHRRKAFGSQARAESLRHVTDAERAGDDRRGELTDLVHDQVRGPVADDRAQRIDHRRQGHVDEESREHECRHVLWREIL